MIFGIVCLLVLAIVLFCFLIYIYVLKRDIKNLSEQLAEIKYSRINKKLISRTMEKEIVQLIMNINSILDQQEYMVQQSNHASLELKQAISNVSHDLRTPLTSALGYVQLLKKGEITQDKKLEYLTVIESRLKVLSDLMNELFEFTQIVEGNVSAVPEKVNVNNVLRNVLSSFYEDFSRKGITPEVYISEESFILVCNENALKRIFQNLIKNSIVHGGEHVWVMLDGNQRQFVIKNSAHNIEQLEIERLFERFYTADAARSKDSTGLGLAIVKELVERIGGSIYAVKENQLLVIIVQF